MSDIRTSREVVSGAFVLSPSAGKKLIGMAVAAMPEVQKAYKGGRLAIANGTTTAYVIEMLTGQPKRKFNYCIGTIGGGKFTEVVKQDRDPMMMWYNGQPSSTPLAEFIREFERDDVFIKGANAVDPYGFAGGLQGNPKGGTWAEVLGTITARGCQCIVPVGLEKMIPSVVEAARKAGQKRLTYSLGSPVGLVPVTIGTVITEVQALELLAGVKATPIAAGGIGNDQGAVGFVIEGSKEQVEKAFGFVKQVFQEPPVEVEGQIAPLPHDLPQGQGW